MPEAARKPIEILGVPMDLGQDRRGVDMGPSAIRYARLKSGLENLGYPVEYLGNVEPPIPELARIGEGMRHLNAVRDVCAKVSERAQEMISRGTFPVFLGGDHSISIGTVSGVAATERTGVIWLDAHADYNTHDTLTVRQHPRYATRRTYRTGTPGSRRHRGERRGRAS